MVASGIGSWSYVYPSLQVHSGEYAYSSPSWYLQTLAQFFGVKERMGSAPSKGFPKLIAMES